MNIKDYFKEKLLFILINLILFIPVSVFMYYINLDFIWIISIFIIWFLPMSVYFIMSYIKKANFYNSIVKSMNNLDKKYLLFETIEEPNFIEGKIIFNALRDIEHNICDNIRVYEDKQIGYREYIEAWIHEVKTPIASSKLTIENNKNEVTRNIEKDIIQIESFVEQVLYYSRSEDTSTDYVVKDIKLESVIKEIIKKKARDFIYRDISLSLENLDFIVYTDSKWIEFMINQILINSIKYSKKENACIKIYAQKNNNNVVLSIEDNGVGIPKEDVRRAFNKGFTGNNGRKYGESTGMGLYICNNLAKKLGLGIELTSEENKYTKVNIIFPLGKITLLES